jgi:hypothetical protein
MRSTGRLNALHPIRGLKRTSPVWSVQHPVPQSDFKVQLKLTAPLREDCRQFVSCRAVTDESAGSPGFVQHFIEWRVPPRTGLPAYRWVQFCLPNPRLVPALPHRSRLQKITRFWLTMEFGEASKHSGRSSRTSLKFSEEVGKFLTPSPLKFALFGEQNHV